MICEREKKSHIRPPARAKTSRSPDKDWESIIQCLWCWMKTTVLHHSRAGNTDDKCSFGLSTDFNPNKPVEVLSHVCYFICKTLWPVKYRDLPSSSVFCDPQKTRSDLLSIHRWLLNKQRNNPLQRSLCCGECPAMAFSSDHWLTSALLRNL